MITLNEVGSAVYGAFRLAKRDPGGLAFLDRSARGALNSFYAAALILPFDFAKLTAIRWEYLSKTESIPRWLALALIAYIIGWTLVPVLMISVTRWMDRWDRYCDFLVAYNWSQVIVTAAWLPLHILRHTKVIPLETFRFFAFGLLFLTLFYYWYVTKVSLDVSGGMAASLVAGQYAIGLVLFQISKAIIYGG